MKVHPHRRRTRFAALTLLSWILWLPSCGDPPSEDDAGGSNEVEVRYVSETTCKGCHPAEEKAWRGSHHQLAMQVATEATVLADFDDATFVRHGVTNRFYRRDDRFYVQTDSSAGALREYEILYVFGIDPLQQYLVAVGDGHLQVLATCWDVTEGRWFHIYDEPIRHDDPLHWTGRFQNWNYMCAECHVTEYDKGYDADTNSFESTWRALGVGCQECHGPGSAHVAWAERVGETVASYPADDPKGLVVDLAAEDASVQVDACARCHARRDIVHAPYEHGAPLLDHYEPELLVSPLYFPDGQILDEVYVYGSFLQSKKHARGVRCTDCHDPHTARLKAEGNDVCTQCHRAAPPERFPTLSERTKTYDDPSHHHHEAGTPGSACVDCHMPDTTYMQVDPRRDHAFRIPRPDLSVSLGVPNACTSCHAEEGPAWAGEQIATWYPESASERFGAAGFAATFARARTDDPRALDGLIRLVRDREEPAIVRATALREMRRFSEPRTLEAARQHVDDPDALVRLAALDLVQGLIPPQAPETWLKLKRDLVAPRLADPLRAVRVEAARVLADVPGALLEPSTRAVRDAALGEFRARQAALADRPESWLNLGALEVSLGRDAEAERAYRHALEITPDFIPVRFNLANLLNRTGRNAEAERRLREVIELMPEHGEAHYSLGLLLAERDRYGDAAQALSHAADLMPGRPRVHYNRALVLQRLGRHPEARVGLERAHEIDPSSPEVVHALALLHLQRGRPGDAKPWAVKLARLLPGDPGAARLLETIETELR